MILVLIGLATLKPDERLKNPMQRQEMAGITLVVGLGKSGESAARALRALGVAFAVTDSRANPPGLSTLQAECPEVPRSLGGFDPAAFAKAARLLVSPGVSVKTPVIAAAAARGVPIWGDIELLAQLTTAPIAAITGSNGKSTVTTLLGLMAERAGIRAAVGGNLGEPVDLWLQQERNAGNPLDCYVLELSSFQLETTHSLKARVATVLNISPDHLDRYDGLEEYIAAKRRIFQGDGVMVVNADDPAVMAMIELWPGSGALHPERTGRRRLRVVAGGRRNLAGLRARALDRGLS